MVTKVTMVTKQDAGDRSRHSKESSTLILDSPLVAIIIAIVYLPKY